jgi:glutamine amidotransferase
MDVVVADYGVGNLFSISKGLEVAGAKARVVSDLTELLDADCVVLPGVGAFGAAMEALKPVLPQLRARILSGVPTLGICLGMQLLFDKSEESSGEGLSVLSGDVRKLKTGRIPQMGWNNVEWVEDDLFDGLPKSPLFYFANSYVCRPSKDIEIATTDYGERFPSAVRDGSVVGVQFHPEKSGPPGLKLLSNFISIAEEAI